MISVENSKDSVLRKAADQIGKTIRIDDTTRATTKGKFARVCLEVDLRYPLMSHYRHRGKDLHIQYKGLQEICFRCGKYGHGEIHCAKPKPTSGENHQASGSTSQESAGPGETSMANDGSEKKDHGAFGPWTIARRGVR